MEEAVASRPIDAGPWTEPGEEDDAVLGLEDRAVLADAQPVRPRRAFQPLHVEAGPCLAGILPHPGDGITKPSPKGPRQVAKVTLSAPRKLDPPCHPVTV